MSNWPISHFDAFRRMQSKSAKSDKPRISKESSPKSHVPVRERGELIVRSVGIVLAIASTSFAAYMISDNERQPKFAGLEHLAIFSRPNLSAARRAQTQIAADQRNKVDYTPVGSISDTREERPVSGFVLLGVRSGAALIKAPKTVVRVVEGDVVEGLGRILAIERRGDRWVVVTPNGLVVSN